MKFEFTSNEESLKLNGKTIPRIWMIDYDSSRKRISIVYPPNHLIEKVNIKDIYVNGESYDSLERLSEVLTDILFTTTNREFSNEFN